MAKFFVATVALVGMFSQSSRTALEEFAELHDEADSARASGDLPARLRAVLKIEKFLNYAPGAMEAVAPAYAEVGDADRALDVLTEFADLGQVDDRVLRGENKAFAALEKRPRYKSILKRFALNKAPISRSETTVSLHDPGLLAEDIDYDPAPIGLWCDHKAVHCHLCRPNEVATGIHLNRKHRSVVGDCAKSVVFPSGV